MTPHQFNLILSLLDENLRRQHLWEPICPAEHLAMTLRYLSSGDLIQGIALSFRVGISTARLAVRVTCRALWTKLQPLYLAEPDTAAWLRVAEGFNRDWQFPNSVGAVDGKHIQIHAPAHSGSMYFNYKGTYSIVLMAIVDSGYRFVVVDVGAYLKQSDGGSSNSQFLGSCWNRAASGCQAISCYPRPNCLLHASSSGTRRFS
ncbi:unnamed protein product [Ixodes pacificus]